jgi:hypothetical protein
LALCRSLEAAPANEEGVEGVTKRRKRARTVDRRRLYPAERLLMPIAREISFAASGLLILDAVYTNKKAKRVMEHSAATFFEITGIALQREVTMTVARLSDPPQVGKYPTICIRRLVDSIPSTCGIEVRAKLLADVAEIESRSEPIRAWRDKYIAHNDLDESVSEDPLQEFSIEVIRDLVKRLGILIEATGDALSLSKVFKPHIVLQVDGGKRLLHVLRLGIAADDDSWERD